MSVAFRRESDEDHKEPRFELPLPPGPNIVTKRGLALIAERLSALEEALADAADAEARAPIERELRYWRTRSATAELAPAPPADEVAFGSRVTFSFDGGAPRTIDIVGDDEADPAAGRLAFSAPLARAMIGAGAEETVDYAGRADAIRILATAAIPDA